MGVMIERTGGPSAMVKQLADVLARDEVVRTLVSFEIAQRGDGAWFACYDVGDSADRTGPTLPTWYYRLRNEAEAQKCQWHYRHGGIDAVRRFLEGEREGQ